MNKLYFFILISQTLLFQLKLKKRKYLKISSFVVCSLLLDLRVIYSHGLQKESRIVHAIFSKGDRWLRIASFSLLLNFEAVVFDLKEEVI